MDDTTQAASDLVHHQKANENPGLDSGFDSLSNCDGGVAKQSTAQREDGQKELCGPKQDIFEPRSTPQINIQEGTSCHVGLSNGGRDSTESTSDNTTDTKDPNDALTDNSGDDDAKAVIMEKNIKSNREIPIFDINRSKYQNEVFLGKAKRTFLDGLQSVKDIMRHSLSFSTINGYSYDMKESSHDKPLQSQQNNWNKLGLKAGKDHEVLKENLQPETFNKIYFGVVNSVPMEQLGNILCAVISKTKRCGENIPAASELNKLSIFHSLARALNTPAENRDSSWFYQPINANLDVWAVEYQRGQENLPPGPHPPNNRLEHAAAFHVYQELEVDHEHEHDPGPTLQLPPLINLVGHLREENNREVENSAVQHPVPAPDSDLPELSNLIEFIVHPDEP